MVETAERIRIYLVEDEPTTRELFGLVFELEGFEVSAFETAEDVLAASGPAPAALITDLTLSGSMSGVELARALQARSELAEVVRFAITGWDPKTLPAADVALFRQVFLKPVAAEEVAAAIRAAVSAT